MINSSKLYLAIALASLTIISCSKSATEIDPEFEGDWISVGASETTYKEIEINEDGHANFESYENGQRVDFANGRIKLQDDRLKIGSSKIFRINEFPGQNQGSTFTTEVEGENYVMKLDGINYVRK